MKSLSSIYSLGVIAALVAPIFFCSAGGADPFPDTSPMLVCRFEGVFDPIQQKWVRGEYRPYTLTLQASSNSSDQKWVNEAVVQVLKLYFQNTDLEKKRVEADTRNDGPMFQQLHAKIAENNTLCETLKAEVNKYRETYGMRPLYGVRHVENDISYNGCVDFLKSCFLCPSQRH